MIRDLIRKNILESMTRNEVLIKNQLIHFLKEDGFVTFGDYLRPFHVNLMTSAEAGQPFVAAIDAKNGIIYVNPSLDLSCVSLILRHEIAHSVFKHMEHMFAKLKEMGIEEPNDLALYLANKAGDYHISNYIYDDEDKKLAKEILVDGDIFPGLVTELDFPENPEYWTMDFDQLWDVFVKDYDIKSLTQEMIQKSSEKGKPDDSPARPETKTSRDVNKPLTQKDLDEIKDKMKSIRDPSKDVIDDNDELISDKTAEKIEQELSDIENELEKPELKSPEKLSKLEARLRAIRDFWNSDENIRKVKNDSTYRKELKELRRKLEIAKQNSANINKKYPKINIRNIAADIVRTLKAESAEIRDSSYEYYNSRSEDAGYVVPGRYTTEKAKKKPKVLFYFDVSGSWRGNEPKIKMGELIENELKKLHAQKKIELTCKYFADKTSENIDQCGYGNSDAPLPDIIELAEHRLIDNVIIMTDDNPDSYGKSVTLPGFVWLLFYDTVCDFVDTVRGKKGTKIYMIDHN